MPGGIGPVDRATLAACAGGDRGLSPLGNANEIFFNLDTRRVYYDRAGRYLYFVDTPDERIGRTIRAVLGAAGVGPVFEQLHLDRHCLFSAARRVGLDGDQAISVLMALRLAGIRVSAG